MRFLPSRGVRETSYFFSPRCSAFLSLQGNLITATVTRHSPIQKCRRLRAAPFDLHCTVPTRCPGNARVPSPRIPPAPISTMTRLRQPAIITFPPVPAGPRPGEPCRSCYSSFFFSIRALHRFKSGRALTPRRPPMGLGVSSRAAWSSSPTVTVADLFVRETD